MDDPTFCLSDFDGVAINFDSVLGDVKEYYENFSSQLSQLNETETNIVDILLDLEENPSLKTLCSSPLSPSSTSIINNIEKTIQQNKNNHLSAKPPPPVTNDNNVILTPHEFYSTTPPDSPLPAIFTLRIGEYHFFSSYIDNNKTPFKAT